MDENYQEEKEMGEDYKDKDMDEAFALQERFQKLANIIKG